MAPPATAPLLLPDLLPPCDEVALGVETEMEPDERIERMTDIKVKLLEWEDFNPDSVFGIVSRAECPFPGQGGTYIIYDDAACDDDPVVDEKTGSFWFSADCYHLSLDAAKVAAQADFERRVLACIETP